MSKLKKNRKQKFRLQISASTDNLQIVRDFVHRLTTDAGFSTDQIDQIELAVDEACTNAMKHAYHYDTSKMIDIEIALDAEKIEIKVIDYGPGFDPQSLPSPDINHAMKKARAGGLGIHLIKKVMDEVNFHIEPGKKTEVQMVKFKKAINVQ